MIAEPARYGGGWLIRNAAGKYLTSVTVRGVHALGAVKAGRVRTIERRSYSYWTCDVRTVAVCDVFGVGEGTLYELARDGFRHLPLVAYPPEPGPVTLTKWGVRAVAALEAAGVEFGRQELPDAVPSRVAAAAVADDWSSPSATPRR